MILHTSPIPYRYIERPIIVPSHALEFDLAQMRCHAPPPRCRTLATPSESWEGAQSSDHNLAPANASPWPSDRPIIAHGAKPECWRPIPLLVSPKRRMIINWLQRKPILSMGLVHPPCQPQTAASHNLVAARAQPVSVSIYVGGRPIIAYCAQPMCLASYPYPLPAPSGG